MTKKEISRAIGAIDVSSRSKRLQAVSIVIDLLEKIRVAEEENIDRFPANLRFGYAFVKAGDSLEFITDAIIGLRDAYY
ncbi:MAG: hypothetical protein LBH28_11490 [Oscillospiraceae bacterium]|nr:hypothetical protein [Oscillospiraceae bacterium]